jgi:hypothetical protein
MVMRSDEARRGTRHPCPESAFIATGCHSHSLQRFRRHPPPGAGKLRDRRDLLPVAVPPFTRGDHMTRRFNIPLYIALLAIGLLGWVAYEQHMLFAEAVQLID